jgi:GNAT superfamily N-acetyltransferase
MPSHATFGPPLKIDSIVDIRDLLEKNPAKAMDLFDKGFKIYCDCFPDPSERESQEALLGYLKDPEVNWRMYIALDKDGTVIGGRNMNIMETTLKDELVPFAWGEHLYVNTAPQYRRLGIGSSIVQQTNSALKDFGVGLVFSEQNDPYLMSKEEVSVDLQSGISPEQRLEFWGKQGYRALDVPYAQPTLDGGDPVFYLRLCCHVVDPTLIPEAVGFTGRGIDREAYLSMIRHFHGTFVEDMEMDPTSGYIKELVETGPKEIRFIPIAERRSFEQDRIDLSN